MKEPKHAVLRIDSRQKVQHLKHFLTQDPIEKCKVNLGKLTTDRKDKSSWSMPLLDGSKNNNPLLLNFKVPKARIQSQTDTRKVHRSLGHVLERWQTTDLTTLARTLNKKEHILNVAVAVQLPNTPPSDLPASHSL